MIHCVDLVRENIFSLYFRTLTQYTPESGPHSIRTPEIQNQITEPAMTHLVLAEQKNLNILFSVLSSTSTDLLNDNEMKASRKNGLYGFKDESQLEEVIRGWRRKIYKE